MSVFSGHISIAYFWGILLLSYLIGSTPFGYLAVKHLKGIDLRKEGSGSTGATNVSRILGKKWFLIISVLDVFKGILPVIIASYVMNANFREPYVLLCGFLSVTGHVFPVWLRFRGGKGVNTTLGVLLMVAPLPVLACLFVFIFVFYISKYISLSSISAGLFFPVSLLCEALINDVRQPVPMIVLGFLVPSVILITHRQNIKRLLKNEENPFGKLKESNK